MTQSYLQLQKNRIKHACVFICRTLIAFLTTRIRRKHAHHQLIIFQILHASIISDVRKIDDYNISCQSCFCFLHFYFYHIRRQCLTHWLKRKKKEIEAVTTTITTTTMTAKRKRSSKSRILSVYVLINIALFIYSNEEILIIMTEIWNLIWRCIKSIKIFIITLTIIVFVISKSSFAFTKRIYMMLTLLNKHLQAVKRAEQIKNIYI